MEAIVRHRTHSFEFKRQIVQDNLAGETLHGLAKRHDLLRNLVRIWVQKFEAGAFDDEAVAADPIGAYETRIGTRERLVGRQSLEIEFLRGLSDEAYCRRAYQRLGREPRLEVVDQRITGCQSDPPEATCSVRCDIGTAAHAGTLVP